MCMRVCVYEEEHQNLISSKSLKI